MRNIKLPEHSFTGYPFVIGIGVLLALVSCTQHSPHRPLRKGKNVDYVTSIKDRTGKYINEREGRFDVSKASPEAHECLEKHDGKHFWLGHVEFTDFGSYWDQRQISLIERTLVENGEGGPGKLFVNGATIMVYVHGWQNNAKEGNGNLSEFRKLLAEQAAYEQKKEPSKRRGVLGFYISWRGQSVTVPLVSHLSTYWGRKRVAHRVGQGNLVETLARIKNVHKLLAAQATNKDTSTIYKENRLVLIGHSFGAAALYSAVAGNLESDFLDKYWFARREAKRTGVEKEMEQVSGYGDLVVLINPAFEALPYRSLHYAVQTNVNVNYDSKQPVLMLVLSGKGDTANRVALPFGQFFGNRQQVFSLKKSDRNQVKTESAQMLSSLGHWKSFHSHELEIDKSGKPCLRANEEYFRTREGRKDEDGDAILSSQRQIKYLNLKATPGTKVNVAEGTPLLPFMVVSVDKGIINGHSGFWAGNSGGKESSNTMAKDFITWLIAVQNKHVTDIRAVQAAEFSREVIQMKKN